MQFNHNEMIKVMINYSYLKNVFNSRNNLLTISIIIVSLGCIKRDKYDKTDPRVVYELENNHLHIEIYRTAGYGVYGGDIESVYITDSLSFRKFIGEKDDNQEFRFRLNGDSIICTKLELGYEIKNETVPDKLLSEKIYSIRKLQLNKEFD